MFFSFDLFKSFIARVAIEIWEMTELFGTQAPVVLVHLVGDARIPVVPRIAFEMRTCELVKGKR